ncbi:MAG TPA: hypothetical protein PKN95_13060 [Verrucomicrobiota bacterium]|nr:hypothetical protein [Verrucomicrobiota bacterium]HNT15365.1 hypothetical protein [Verrucomicrobiota bacterium]
MPLPGESTTADLLPLVVDLDGTLMRSDLMWESLRLWLPPNPLRLGAVLIWWMRGRAFLKQQLGRRVKVNPGSLPYHAEFLDWLRSEKRRGRKLILATASDYAMALPVFQHVGIFDEFMASDGKTNLRGANKRRALSARFGERGYDYAGNSVVDLGVWPGCRAAIVVNAHPRLAARAARVTRVARVFR